MLHSFQERRADRVPLTVDELGENGTKIVVATAGSAGFIPVELPDFLKLPVIREESLGNFLQVAGSEFVLFFDHFHEEVECADIHFSIVTQTLHQSQGLP